MNLFAAKEIGTALGISRQGVLKRARRENWPCEEVSNESGGGKQFRFSFEKLPADVKSALVAQTFKCDPSIFPQACNLSLSNAGRALAKWSNARERHQERAAVRAQILKAIDAFCREKGFGQTRGEEVFAMLYASKGAPFLTEKAYAVENSLSAAKIRRLRARFKKEGLAGLLPGYQPGKSQAKAVTHEIEIFVTSHIARKPHIRPARLFELVRKTFPAAPSRRTIYRFVAHWKRSNPQLSAMIEDPRKWKNNFDPAFGDMAAGVDHFCHTWEMDSTPADIITADGKRCAVVGAIDIFSRRAVLLAAPASRSTAIAACMRKALIRWGIPARIRKDNGKDYSSRHIEHVVRSLGIETPPLPKYSPEKKPFIERFFGTFAKGLEELLPGYCGHSVPERQAIRERQTWSSKILEPGEAVEVPLTLDEFQRAADRWIDEIYERQAHSGLDGETPYRRSRKSPFHPPKIRDERVLDVLLAPVSRPRKVSKKGIWIDRALFTASELVECVGVRVECRMDLSDAGSIFVFRSRDGSFICKASCEPLSGQRLEEYIAAKKKNKKNLKEKIKALGSLNMGDRDALQIMLEDNLQHGREEEKVIPFQPEAESPSILEARKAVAADSRPEPSVELPEAPSGRVDRPLPDPVSGEWETDADIDRLFEEAMEVFSQHKAVNAP